LNTWSLLVAVVPMLAVAEQVVIGQMFLAPHLGVGLRLNQVFPLPQELHIR
jgi:hypothetical protein